MKITLDVTPGEAQILRDAVLCIRDHGLTPPTLRERASQLYDRVQEALDKL